MPNIVIDIIVAIIAAVMAVFLILIAINIALVRKLRSIITPSPRSSSLAPRARTPGRENARR